MTTMVLTGNPAAAPPEIPASVKLTPDDLLSMPDAGRFELIDGHELTGGHVPGFLCPVAALFPPPVADELPSTPASVEG